MTHSIGPGHRMRGIAMLAAVIPVAISQLSRLLDDTGPASASATPAVSGGNGIVIPPETPVAPTRAQSRALAWLRSNVASSPISDPFETNARRELVVTAHAPVDEGAPPATVPPTAGPTPPALKVSGFMGKDGGAMVTMNRRVRRVGDEVSPGWTLTAIDPIARSVRVQHSSGVEVEVASGAKGEK